MNIKIKKLNENAKIPTYAHIGDAGMDITATGYDYDEDKDVYIYHTGLAFEVPKGYVMLIFPRSSNRKTESYLSNSVGVLDSGYRGELLVCYKNRTRQAVVSYMKSIVSYIKRVDKERYNLQDNLSDMLNDIDYPANADNCLDDDVFISAPYGPGDRIAQIIILPYPEIKFDEVKKLSDTERGEGSFGSTGK